jgi:signal transduction histidine kinase
MWKELRIFAVSMNTRRLFITTLLVGICLSAMAYNDHRNAKVDSLEAALKSANPPKGDDLLRAYDNLMRGWMPYDTQKASEYGRKALALSYERNGLNVRQNILRLFAQMHYAREEHDEAIRLFQWALAVVDTMEQSGRYKQMDIDDARSCTYGAIGNDYNIQDKHHLAIHYYQLALPIFEKYNWTESQTILYHNIGELYLTMGNLQEAERNYLMAVKKSEASGDSLMMAIARKGLFKVYTRQDDYKQAKATAEKCYAYYHPHRTEEPEDYPVVLAAMTRLNMMNGHENLTAAKTYIQEALTLADSLRFEDKSDVYAAACEVAMAEKQWQQALGYALQTIRPDSLATTADASCYKMLAEIYTQLGQKDKASLYIDKVYEVMTRYATDHYQSGLSQMEVLYETEKKEAQIAALDKERGLYLWLLAAAIGLIVLLAVLFIYRHLAHRRQKALLAAKVALETETKERRILARDLHDGLGGMLSVLRMKLEACSGEFVNSAEPGVLALLDAINKELRRTAHHLMPEELLKNGLESALHDFAVSVPNAKFQAIGNIQLDKDKELVLYRCAYELVNNALKHAKASKIDIQLMQDSKEVTLTVSDNGKGIAVANSKLSTLNSQLNEGMGLQNIRERIEPYKGRLDIVSADGKGTDVNITLNIEDRR